MKNYRFIYVLVFLCSYFLSFSQINDNCISAINIAMPGNGFANGTVFTDTFDISNASSEIGEYYAPSVPNGKSIWFKFSIQTTKQVVILLDHLGNTPSNTAGWTLYKTNSCLPNNTSLISPPLSNIEGYTHSCLLKGDYLLQLTADFDLIDSLFFVINVLNSDAAEIDHDFGPTAYDFGTLTNAIYKNYSFEMGCQSIYEDELACATDFSKSAWQTFTTDNVVDFVRFRLKESPWNPLNFNPRIWYVNLYEGDVKIDSSTLVLIDSCVQMVQITDADFTNVDWDCILKNNTTYSIQILSKTNYFYTINTKITQLGEDTTKGAQAQNLGANNSLGVLNIGDTYDVTDFFSCNAHWDYYTCPPFTDTIFSLIEPQDHPVNWWITFNIPVPTGLNIEMADLWGYMGNSYFANQPTPIYQLYAGNIENSCALIPIDEPYLCIDSGSYTILVSGDGYEENKNFLTVSNIGKSATFHINTAVDGNKFDLANPNKIDSVNNLIALVSNTIYNTVPNLFDCDKTVLPQADTCNTGPLQTDRAMYRLIHIDTVGVLTISAYSSIFQYKLFQGNLATLPIVNNEIVGANEYSCCTRMFFNEEKIVLCVDSGLYTLVVYTNESNFDAEETTRVTFFKDKENNSAENPLTPQVLDTIFAQNSQQYIQFDHAYISCTSNPDTILGHSPCNGFTNLTYREFYLDESMAFKIKDVGSHYYHQKNVRRRIFSGRISQSNITTLEIDCFYELNPFICDTLTKGWYTMVSYNKVDENIPSCEQTTAGTQEQVAFITFSTNTPKFNTFAKADSVFLNWQERSGHTDTIPLLNKAVLMTKESFSCKNDLSFPPGIVGCDTSIYDKIVYRVFHIPKPTMLIMHSFYLLKATLYEGNITENAPPYIPLVECASRNTMLCLDSGIYTLVSFGRDFMAGKEKRISLYIDSLGTKSKYDYAKDAYNFGVIPDNGVAYRYNPSIPTDSSADSYGRPASNDFIMCKTSASLSDPSNIGFDRMCYVASNASGRRKTIWYTFVLDKPGGCHLYLDNLTEGKATVAWDVYEADSMNYPLIDSTQATLKIIGRSLYSCDGNPDHSTSIYFERDGCTALDPTRYVVMVSNVANKDIKDMRYEPNLQVQLSIKLDSFVTLPILYDHFSQANEINAIPTIQCLAPYPNDTISYGTYTGCVGNLQCATRDITDGGAGSNTIWYKFNAEGSGTVRINYERLDNNQIDYDEEEIFLYRQILPNDSSSSGLQRINLTSAFYNNNPEISGNNKWGEGCFSTGTYYIMFSGKTFPNARVKPNVWLENIKGDFCFDPIKYYINGEDTSFAIGTVDCWTMGEAPGEATLNLGCIDSPAVKKTGWFQIVVTNDSIYDIDISLDENTNVPASDFSYRLAYGTCNALTYKNCVEDGGFLTLNLKCRNDTGMYIQVVMPDYAVGTVNLNVKSRFASDSLCNPDNLYLPEANFNYITACGNNDVEFINESTIGPVISYLWNFGDGFTSTDINPTHLYSSPAVGDFVVSLITTNGNLSDTSIRTVNVISYPNPVFTFNPPIIANHSTIISNFSFDTIASSQYNWYLGAVNNSNQNDTLYSWNLDYTFTTAEAYYVCFYINNAGCENTFCDTITTETINMYRGGIFDGFDLKYTFCNDTIINVYKGGIFDGFGIDTVLCHTTETFIYLGGEHDGFSMKNVLCNDSLTNIYKGGEFDGFDFDFEMCHIRTMFSGGDFDGEGSDIYKENCTVQTMFSGGFYDGEGTDILKNNCFVLSNIYKGGEYDGFKNINENCISNLTNVYKGGEFDGKSIVNTNCVINTTNVYKGGEFDGYDVNKTLCLSLLTNVYKGGIFDGFDLVKDNCPPTPFIYLGGSYDGFDLKNNESISNNKQTICDVDTAVLNTGFSTNWYNDLFAVNAIAEDTNALHLTNISNSALYYVEAKCYPATGRSEYFLEYLHKPKPTFIFSNSCTGTTFQNTTLVSGPKTQTIGTDISGVSATGSPANAGKLSVSTATYLNYNRFNDNQLTLNCWRENNSIESKEWLQVNYLTEKSLNEIEFWYESPLKSVHAKQIRLYYFDGISWKLVWVEQNIENQTSGKHYQSGNICASSNIFANRWKIEFDTKDNAVLSLNELNLFASNPIVGGNVNWTIDGNSFSGQTVNYDFSTSGFYDIEIDVNENCTCIAKDTVSIEIVKIENASLQKTDVICKNSNEGKLELIVNNIDSVNFVWYDNDSVSLTKESLLAGNYWVYVSRKNELCNDTIYATITEPDSLINDTMTVYNQDTITGTASVEVFPFEGDGPYTIIWNNADTINPKDSLLGWNYVEIIDHKGCSKLDTVFINSLNTLPIELLDFSGINAGKENILMWTTSTEINNDYFTLYRSERANNWQEIAIVDGNGNSNELLDYNFIDTEPKFPISYYYLKQTDFDGQTTNSNIISITKNIGIETFGLLNLFPNPANGSFSFQYAFSEDSNLKVEIYDFLGKTIFTKDYKNESQGILNQRIETTNLAKGIYWISFSEKDKIEKRKMVLISSK